MQEALATYVQRAVEKLRAQSSHRNVQSRRGGGTLIELPHPTNGMLLMTRAACEAVERIYRPGYRYSKVEVLLLDQLLTIRS